MPGGGRQLNSRQSWPLDVNAGTAGARIWVRTGCSFDGSGRGRCQTGDCGGLLQCQGYGAAPNTLAEFALNKFQNLDVFSLTSLLLMGLMFLWILALPLVGAPEE